MVYALPRFVVALALALLAACVASDPPVLSPSDLAEVPGLAYHYGVAEAGAEAGWIEITRAEDGSYRLVEVAGAAGEQRETRNAGNQLRVLELAPTRFLAIGIYWSPLFDGHIYFYLDRMPNGELVLSDIDLGKAGLDPEFVAYVRARYDIVASFADELDDDSGVSRTQLEGVLDAARLRGLFTDPVFLARAKTPVVKRLVPLR